MNDDKLQEYTVRITQANRSELVVIVYELFLKDIEEAMNALEKKENEEYNRKLKHAGKYLSELMKGLDFSYIISNDLMQIYLFVNKQLITAMLKKERSYLDGVERIMQNLLVGFEGMARQDTSGPVMKNTQQVYAGLTYGKGTLTEMSLDPEYNNRGFQA